jgi:hypothetical protein
MTDGHQVGLSATLPHMNHPRDSRISNGIDI